ncbi:MAG TPA: peptide ABC transporter substrate-binding protein [Bacteroidia bacterium]|nr:peptide ABC transporter substrate-binding protein [Bacteroidia bacterium]
MTKIFTCTVLSVFIILVSCSGKKPAETSQEETTKGGILRGGVLNVNEIDHFKSLMPIAISEQNSYHIASQIYEGLVKYNPFDLSLVPGIAKSWTISPDQTEYTFFLRTNAKFHDDPCFETGKGRYATASDVKYSFESLCSVNLNNTQFDITFRDRVVGANENYNESGSGKVHSISGVSVINDSCLKIKLVGPEPNFLNILAMPGCYIYPREAGLTYGNQLRIHCVGTGPFYLEKLKEGEFVDLKRNKDYWGRDIHGNRLPYLDGIHWTFLPDKSTELEAFRSGQLDVVYNTPIDLLQRTLGVIQDGSDSHLDFDIYTSPALSTHFYGFNVQMNPFFSIREIRRAFNLAIDRQKLANVTLKREGSAAIYGIVPYTKSFEKSNYNYKTLRGFVFDPDSARKLLELSGYPGGKGLPDFTLEINSGGGERNLMLALAVQKMLKDNLGLNVNLSVLPWSQHLNNVNSGKSDFFRYTWVSDYPDPESFLTLFYGPHVPEKLEQQSFVNVGRYKNKAFDTLFLQARFELNKSKRYELLQKAEQVLLDDAAMMPLFYDENSRLVKKNVKNFRENPMAYMDMSFVYFSPQKKSQTLSQ